jgi:hypothetical protein
MNPKIDAFSYKVGMINCFVEMVACGVKKLAIKISQKESVSPYSSIGDEQ